MGLAIQLMLRKDMLCKPCFKSYYPHYSFKAFLMGSRTKKPRAMKPRTSHTCTFMERPQRYVYCSGCELYHPTMAFSPTQQQVSSGQRICIGREGVLRVCDHLSLTWAKVEARLNGVPKPNSFEEWGQFVQSLEEIEWVCTHESHNFPCKVDGREPDSSPHPQPGPTFPRVQVRIDNREGRLGSGTCARIMLKMTWSPHSGRLQWPLKKGVGQLETDAVGMRDMAACWRQAGGRFLLPEVKEGSLPEMLCYNADRCACLHYEGGLYQKKRGCGQGARNGTRHHYELGNHNDKSHVEIKQCDDPHDGGRVKDCVVTCYRRSIYVGEFAQASVYVARAGIQRGPTHEWFHAVDVGSYELGRDVPRARRRTSVRPRCESASCSRHSGRTGTCHTVDGWASFLSVEESQGPSIEGAVMEPWWVRPRAERSLDNIGYWVAETTYDVVEATLGSLVAGAAAKKLCSWLVRDAEVPSELGDETRD